MIHPGYLKCRHPAIGYHVFDGRLHYTLLIPLQALDQLTASWRCPKPYPNKIMRHSTPPQNGWLRTRSSWIIITPNTPLRVSESPPNQSTAKTPRKPTPGRLEKLSMRPSICASSPSCSPTSKPSRPSSVSSSESCCVKRSASWKPMESGSYGAPLVEVMLGKAIYHPTMDVS